MACLFISNFQFTVGEMQNLMNRRERCLLGLCVYVCVCVYEKSLCTYIDFKLWLFPAPLPFYRVKPIPIVLCCIPIQFNWYYVLHIKYIKCIYFIFILPRWECFGFCSQFKNLNFIRKSYFTYRLCVVCVSASYEPYLSLSA